MSKPNAMKAYAIYPDLDGKCVVISGGGTGIGAEMVKAYAQQGARVFFFDIAEQASQELAQSLQEVPYPPVFVPCDLVSLDAIGAAFARVVDAAGAVDILINNAANDDRHQIAEVTPAYWDARMAVNLRHQFFCAQAVIPGMRGKGAGVILNLGSISWHLALPNLSLYMTASPAAWRATWASMASASIPSFLAPCARRASKRCGTRPRKKPRSWPRNACANGSKCRTSLPWPCSSRPTTPRAAPGVTISSTPDGTAHDGGPAGLPVAGSCRTGRGAALACR